MKLIDADKLKESIRRNDGYGSWNESDVLCAIDREPEVLLSCPKCHGKGAYMVPCYKDDELLDCVETWKSRRCELCNATGKMSIEFYEMIQSHAREMQK